MAKNYLAIHPVIILEDGIPIRFQDVRNWKTAKVDVCKFGDRNLSGWGVYQENDTKTWQELQSVHATLWLALIDAETAPQESL
jgi:hypothetical protein